MIEEPHVVHSQECDKNNGKNIGLGKGKTKVLTSNFSLRKERNVSFFGYQNVSIHTREEGGLGDTLKDAEFGTAGTRIVCNLLICRDNRFFGDFSQARRRNLLSCDIVDFSDEIGSKALFYQPIFDRMKRDDQDLATDP